MVKVKAAATFASPPDFDFSDAAYGLGSAEDFLDAFADALAHLVARMAGCASIHGR